jgi:acyl-CoA synthetase (AMP-forming)/AMP-acid ligase II
VGPAKFTSIVEAAQTWARERPDVLAYTFLADGEHETTSISFAELDAAARRVAHSLLSAGAAGGRALLVYPPGIDYLIGFFGCLYAGVTAVPAYPPDPGRMERTLPRLQAIVADCTPRVALTTTAVAAFAEAMAANPDLAQLRWISTDRLTAAVPSDALAPVDPGALAFLQYTSGSTASPKGVMVLHRNIIANLQRIEKEQRIADGRCRGGGWLPQYHDMGLIGMCLWAPYCGAPLYLMPPHAFLQRPVRWLQMISRYRLNFSPAPNFAFDLCVRKVTPAEREALDLSSWTCAYVGAEPIRPETLERFAGAFASCGFRWDSFYPCYGLAEATLMVTGAYVPVMRSFGRAALERHEVAPADGTDGRRLAASGQLHDETEVRIVAPDSRVPCAANQVGEIWVAGPGVAAGYRGRSAETEEVFQARLATGEGPFLRTGDLGFLREGNLFIASRAKDLIIVRGRNLHPQDIELTMERAHPALRPGCGAAFSVDVDGMERLVLIQEMAKAEHRPADRNEVIEQIRTAVLREHEVALIEDVGREAEHDGRRTDHQRDPFRFVQ